MSSTPGQAVYTTAHLTPTDVSVLCRHFGLPLPTPDVPLQRILEQQRRTPESLYVALQSTRDVRLMIAAHGLRRAPRRLPPDPQLRPRPLPPLRHAPPRRDTVPPQAPPSATSQRPSLSVTAVLTRVQSPNPKRPGSAARERYALYVVGTPVSVLLSRGLSRADLRWDVARGHVSFSEPSVKSPLPDVGDVIE